MQVQELEPFSYKEVAYRRRFVDTGVTNSLGHNLTELRAAMDVAGNDPDENSNVAGFNRHPDWQAHAHRYAYAGRVIDRLKPASILDVGCGIPPQLPFYLNKNRYRPPADCHYWGLELRATVNNLNALSPWGGLLNRYKAHMHLVKGDIVTDDFSRVDEWSGRFDLVVSFESFEHVPVTYQQEFVNRLFAWTAPGATCLFSTPNGEISDSVAANHVHDGEVRERTYADKLAMAAAAGFEFVEAFGTFGARKYLPTEIQEKYKTDPHWARLNDWYDKSLYNCLVAVANPEHANNALMVFKRPA